MGRLKRENSTQLQGALQVFTSTPSARSFTTPPPEAQHSAKTAGSHVVEASLSHVVPDRGPVRLDCGEPAACVGVPGGLGKSTGCAESQEAQRDVAIAAAILERLFALQGDRVGGSAGGVRIGCAARPAT